MEKEMIILAISLLTLWVLFVYMVYNDINPLKEIINKLKKK